MTGVITSTYASNTWERSATSSAITLNNNGYGGWICGPAKDGRLIISSYAQANNTLYFGYRANTHTENSFTNQMTWDGATGQLSATTVVGAVWNDYAEYRRTINNVKPGQVVAENGDGTQHITTKRMEKGCNIVSDTFGFAIGKTNECKTPIACAGRALVYTNEDRYSYEPGEPVCSGPNGTISKMSKEEKINHPECIVGYVSEIPEYETWGTGNVAVNGRIWIKVV